MRLISSVKSIRHSQVSSSFSEEKITYVVRMNFKTGHKFVKILLILKSSPKAKLFRNGNPALTRRYLETRFYEH
jgi:hypothetical protein